MQRSFSSGKVNNLAIDDTNCIYQRKYSNNKSTTKPKRRFNNIFGNVFEHYNIIIKPKLHRSNSLTEITNKTSDITVDFFKRTSQLLVQDSPRRRIDGSSGDAPGLKLRVTDLTDPTFMSWSFRGKKSKKKPVMSPENFTGKFNNDYVPSYRESDITEANTSTYAENSSTSSFDCNVNKGAAFPFTCTPSGNLKVQSNQVVFQSSTVGVLLADPAQAEVKVKFEGKSVGDGINITEEESQIRIAPPNKPLQKKQAYTVDKNQKTRYPSVREDKGKDLASLGYNNAEPIDWMRMQLPKKLDLFQEFYRRIHNYTNTDMEVHIGNDTFHCHRIVLQIYSTFFDLNTQMEIELPVNNVSPEAFQTIYEWMIFSGPDSNKLLKRENVLDVFCAAQYLSVKDLEDQCWAFIVSEEMFKEDTAFALFREARVKGIAPVMDLMIPRVMRFFLPLVASNDFLELHLDELLIILQSNYICVTSEIEVLMAGVRWLYGDWAARRAKVVDVMRCVRFGLISPWQLVDVKRNPDNEEILEIVNEPEVQQMVDDGLAYVIIKYWYGNNSKNYYHWIDVLGLTEPAERHWIGEEKNHVTYKDFLKYLEQFMVPKDQMYQQMLLMQPPRRSDDHGSMRGMDDKMDMRRPKLDFPLPATLKGLSSPDKDKTFPTMSEFFENRKTSKDYSHSPSPTRSPEPVAFSTYTAVQERRAFHSPDFKTRNVHDPHGSCQYGAMEPTGSLQSPPKPTQVYDPPEKDSEEVTSETSSEVIDLSEKGARKERRVSVAANYLATATAALSGIKGGHTPSRSSFQSPQSQSSQSRHRIPASNSRLPPRPDARSSPPHALPVGTFTSPQISLFNHSKESFARLNMNKLSTSILGPSNKNYISEGSLFNWDRETVLVFGGIDPHDTYGVGRNSGKDIYRFDPVTNVWDVVGELPEPRHYHSVAFLRGRVYLVGGADPRDDDIRGKSVVVSTVWSYEPVAKSWYSESGLAVPRRSFGLVAHRMALYAIGGQDKKGRVLRSVERFDPKTGAWSEVRPMTVARMAAAAVKYREYIWVAGGMTGEKKRPACKIVECYNSKTNEWTQIHNLRFPRCFSTLFSMNDRLYIVGGAGKTTEKEKTISSVGSVDVWDWKSREWKPETEMSIPRHGHSLANLGTQLIIIGGVTTIYMRALSNVESYCCERRTWIRGVSTLPSPLSGHGAVTLPPASLM